MNVNIYRIIDPLTSKTIYVGATKLELQERLRQHLASPQGKKLTEWALSVKLAKQTPVIELIETSQYDQAWKREIHWIKELSKEAELLNDLTPAKYNPLGIKLEEQEKKTNATVYLLESEYDDLKTVARMSGVSVSQYICRLIENDEQYQQIRINNRNEREARKQAQEQAK